MSDQLETTVENVSNYVVIEIEKLALIHIHRTNTEHASKNLMLFIGID